MKRALRSRYIFEFEYSGCHSLYYTNIGLISNFVNRLRFLGMNLAMLVQSWHYRSRPLSWSCPRLRP